MSEYEAFGSTSEGVENYLEPCSICGRRFNPQALNRHYPICQKTAQKTRKVFDASKQRAEGTEINTIKKKSKEPPPRKSNWRQKHEDFINSIRSARGVSEALKTGGPLPPPPPPSINPDYIQCPYCSRRFNESAAERHINFCKEQSQRLPKGKAPQSRVASTKKQYQPPKLKPKQNTTQQYGTSRTQPVSSATRNGSYSGDSYTGYSDTGRAGGITGTPLGRVPKSRYQAGDYVDSSPPSSGKPLRTGRNTETLSGARELSAKQRTTSLKQRTPSNEALNRYPGHSPTSSAGHSNRPTSLYSGNSSPSGRMPGRGYNGRDSGYHDNDVDVHNRRIGSGTAKFCHECGTKYPVPHAKFCCECGIKRIFVT